MAIIKKSLLFTVHYVNGNLTSVRCNLTFLSRLCGGEAFELDKDLLFKFLSRLCGGEDSRYELHRQLLFLSRLCGGEDKLTSHNIYLIFLSRLCGGEVFRYDIITTSKAITINKKS